MDLQQVKAALRRMQSLLQQPVEKEIASRKFYFSRQGSIDSQMQFNLKFIEAQSWNLIELGKDARNRPTILESLFLLEELKVAFQEKKFDIMGEYLQQLEKKLNLIVEEQVTVVVPKNIPAMVKKEVEEDIMEIQRCLQANCFRSVVILCGRVLETCLHRKYFEITGVDILEKNPGIGLGTLVAKLVEKNVKFDPGLTQQIHLINQVRIFSVHKKHATFSPSKAQATAVVLFTIDVLEKLF